MCLLVVNPVHSFTCLEPLKMIMIMIIWENLFATCQNVFTDPVESLLHTALEGGLLSVKLSSRR